MNLKFFTTRVIAGATGLTMGYFVCAFGVQNEKIAVYVHANQVKAHITPWLYGSCIEDVNHEIYGGLYDQKIFGESFEEPIPSAEIVGFTTYEGQWTVQGAALLVGAYPGAKLINESEQLASGTVEVAMKMLGSGDNAGLLLAVSKPGNGADNFYGYEISLTADGKKIIIGKHKHDFEHLKDIPVQCNPYAWNRLKAMLHNGKIKILLNDEPVYAFDNDDPALKAGKIGLRTWNTSVQFRDLKVRKDDTFRTLPLQAVPPKKISNQWDAVETGQVKSAFALDTSHAYHGKQAQMMHFVSGKGMVGIANASLNRWGIAVKNGQRFQGRLYLRSTHLTGAVTVALQSKDGMKTYAKQAVRGVSSQWQKFSFELHSDAEDAHARFVVYLDQPGQVWVDQVTLMGTGDEQFKGLPYRNDIGQAMVKQGLTFLRYGGTMVNVPGYRFKKMIGDADKRPPYTGHWNRYSTNGFGIEDFLKFCEAAGFVPAFAINIEESPQDMADMIEYLNGPVTSEWGKRRAANGHPKPYGVKYIGVGNEEVLFNGDRADEYDHYVERFLLLYDAMKGKDPSVSLVSTAWWRPESPHMERVFHALDGKAAYWDFHPWADQLTSGKEVRKELQRMRELFLKWNPNTTMKCAIFEENGNSHNMQRALGHVTVQNAVRSMGDFVLTSCAANALQPYQQNDNGWDQGQIFFTPSQVWGMPPYYAQQMAAANHQPLLVASEVHGGELDVTATRSEDGKTLVLHVANTGALSKPLQVQIDGFDSVKKMKTITLAGPLTAVNAPDDPEKIIPVEQEFHEVKNQEQIIPPYSYTILVYTQ